MATANEELLNASVRHQVQLLRFSRGEARRAVKLIEKADAELLGQLAKGLTEFGAARAEGLLRSLARTRDALFEQLNGTIQASLDELGQTEAEWEQQALQQAIPVDLQLAVVPPAAIKAAATANIQGIPLDGWLDKMKKADRDRLAQAIRLGFAEAQTTDEIVRRVRGTKAANFQDGVLAINRRNAEALVRTSVNEVSNRARATVWEQNSDIVSGLRWTATLDGRTTAVCRGRDGKVFPLDSGPRPPAHFQCRSLVVAVIDGVNVVGDRPSVRDTRTRDKREVDFRARAREQAGDSWKGMSEADRRARIKAVRDKWADENIGQVPSSQTYDEWLRKQPEAFQDDVLGKGKADLFRKGMTLDQFVDEKGREFSLDELRAKNAGDALHVVQPGVGMKAKALLQQGHSTDEVLKQLKQEFPDASPTAGSIASYKSELKKAGALDELKGKVTKEPGEHLLTHLDTMMNLEQGLSEGVKHAVGGQWYTWADDLSGGAVGHYKAGQGVTFSQKKLKALPVAEQKQVMAHELGHLLHKQHDLLLDPQDFQAMKAKASALDADAKKLYSYYLSHPDELTAEVYAQALSPSPITSQGLSAAKFNGTFADEIAAAKKKLAEKFAPPAPSAPPPPTGGPVIPGETAGKHATVGSLAKALLQQGLDDDQVLAGVKAQFPDAKTGKASLASYKSELKKQGLLPAKQGGPVVVQPTPTVAPPPPPPPAKSPGQAILGDTPFPYEADPSTVKAGAIKLFEAGILKNDDVAKYLQEKYPKNSNTKVTNVASWKTAWKKSQPGAAKKAEQLAASGPGSSPSASVSAPTLAETPKQASDAQKAADALPKPKLHGQKLGYVSSKAKEELKDFIKAGKGWNDVQDFLKSKFTPYDKDKAYPLFELADYEVQYEKLTGKPVAAAVQATPPSWAAPKAQPTVKVDMTPARPAATPAEGLPPPPRFTAEQRKAGIRNFTGSSQLDLGKRDSINANQRKLGLEELTEEEYSAVRMYTGHHYTSLNTALRQGKYASDPNLQAFVDAAQAGMRKLPKFKIDAGKSLNRGVRASGGLLDHVLQTYREGEVVEDHAFVSTSYASGFGGNVRIRVVANRTGVNVAPLSHFASEAEVLYMPGTRFRVRRVTKMRDGMGGGAASYEIELEEV